MDQNLCPPPLGPKFCSETKSFFLTKPFFYPNFLLTHVFYNYLRQFESSVFILNFKLNLNVRFSSFLSSMENSGVNLFSNFIGKSKSRYRVWPCSAQLVYLCLIGHFFFKKLPRAGEKVYKIKNERWMAKATELFVNAEVSCNLPFSIYSL